MSLPSLLSEKLVSWYDRGNRWWFALGLGLLYSFCFPPFNHHTHPLLALFPLWGFVVVVPLMAFSVGLRRRRAMLHTYLYGVGASISQFYWIGNVAPEGQRHLIFLGLALTTLYIGLYYLLAGVAFRITRRYYPRLYLAIFPAVWVLIEYLRGVGEIPFPWTHLGYLFVPYLSTAQAASLCGVFGLSFVVILGNTLVWEVVEGYGRRHWVVPKALNLLVFAVFLGLVTIWGANRLRRGEPVGSTARVAMIQSNIDQLHWSNGSLDTSLEVTRTLIMQSRDRRPDLVVLPESGVFTYLDRRAEVKRRVSAWAGEIGAPLVVGSLHWEPSPGDPYYRYRVFNTAFLVDTAEASFPRYYKMVLVPVSEVMPFEAKLPILGRLNLGEADFKAGNEPTVFRSGALRLAPFICYEVIFPSLVRERVRLGANLLVNITNDGWFGRSTGPYHHAAMARMRCIENGVSLARCANSGISMAVDQYGRVRGRTDLYTRTVLVGDLPVGRLPTPYTRLGDWPVFLSLLVTVAAVIGAVMRGLSRRRGAGGDRALS